MLAISQGATRRGARQIGCSLSLLALVGACTASSTPAPASAPAPTSAPAPVRSGEAAARTEAAPPAPTAPVNLTHVSVAYPARSVTSTGLYVATQRGYTREEGLDAEMVQMGGALSAQGLVGHQIEFGMSAGALLAARMRGVPVTNVFVQIDKPLLYLYAQPEITSMADLAGKSVGIASIGDSTQMAVTAQLAANGMNANQVTFIANASGSNALAALESRQMAATVVSPPQDIVVEQAGFHNLGFLGDHFDFLATGIIVSDDTLRDRPDLVRSMVRAMLKGHRYMKANREGTIALMAQFQDVDQDFAALTYDRYMKYLTQDGISPSERLASVIRNQREELGLDQTVAVDEAFDLRITRQAIEELNREGWRP
jgi:NitT/TauT family transport system substrate-binding protein